MKCTEILSDWSKGRTFDASSNLSVESAASAAVWAWTRGGQVSGKYVVEVAWREHGTDMTSVQCITVELKPAISATELTTINGRVTPRDPATLLFGDTVKMLREIQARLWLDLEGAEQTWNLSKEFDSDTGNAVADVFHRHGLCPCLECVLQVKL